MLKHGSGLSWHRSTGDIVLIMFIIQLGNNYYSLTAKVYILILWSTILQLCMGVNTISALAGNPLMFGGSNQLCLGPLNR